MLSISMFVIILRDTICTIYSVTLLATFPSSSQVKVGKPEKEIYMKLLKDTNFNLHDNTENAKNYEDDTNTSHQDEKNLHPLHEDRDQRQRQLTIL